MELVEELVDLGTKVEDKEDMAEDWRAECGTIADRGHDTDVTLEDNEAREVRGEDSEAREVRGEDSEAREVRGEDSTS
jgi:hypothetical protein